MDDSSETYEIPAHRAERVANHYKYLRRLATNMSRGNAGRQGRALHAEAVQYQEVAVMLLGPDVWAELLARAPGEVTN